MTLPAFLLGCLIATLYGAFFHLIVGGKIGRLFLDLLFGWLGFWLGHAIAGLFGLSFADLGPLHLGLASLCSLGFLFIGHWLTQVDDQKYMR